MAKAFQNFASNIYLADNPKPREVLLITGAEPDQGTSTVVSNLAFSLLEYGKNVIAIDCNLYAPKLQFI